MLEITHVTKQYFDDQNEQITALDHISLMFPQNGLVVITGASGCGKTTLLNILGGLDVPTSGKVFWGDVQIDNKSEQWWDAFRGTNLGFIYQDFNLLENMTVRENLKLPLALLQVEEEIRNNRIDIIASELGISEYLDKRAGKLSGGQKQRVAIARALVTGSEIILADEPTGNLDKENSENVFRVLKKIARNHLVIVVTHDSSLASEYADRLIHIAYGTIESDLTVDKEEEDVAIVDESLVVIEEQRTLSLRECWAFAKEAVRYRKMRCFISILIFSITMIFVFILSTAVFRDDSISMSKYIGEHDQRVIPLYMEVPDAYADLVVSEKISSGRNFYDLISRCTDAGRIIRSVSGVDAEFENDFHVQTQTLYVNLENEQYFTYEGKFPENQNEIAISKLLADKLCVSDSILGTKARINDVEYIITAIVTHISGSDVEDFGNGENTDGNVILLSTKALATETLDRGIYMPGFGVIDYSILYYQTTIYNYINVIDDTLELVAGHMPTNDSEILISEYLYDINTQLGKEVLGKTYTFSDCYDKQYGCAYWNLINLRDFMGESFTVVGVVKNNGDYYVTETLYDKILEEYMTYYDCSYYLLANDSTLAKDLRNLMDNKVRIMGSDFTKIYMLIDGVKTVELAVLATIGGLALLSVLQMISLYTYSINDSKKTIGILRTLGVKKLDTMKIFAVECIVISLVSYVIAIIISFFVISGINNFINEDVWGFCGFDFLRMRFIIVLVVGVISCILSGFSVIIPIMKYSKLKIIDLIK